MQKKKKKIGGTGLTSEITEALYTELIEKAEAATSSHSAVGDFLQYLYSVLVAIYHQKIRSKCSVHEISFTDIFKDINHGCKAAILTKNYLWLLLFYMAVATYCYYEKVRKTMRTETVSYLLKV